MADEPQLDKRRRQNRDSQRRFRERNKTRRSWSVSSVNLGELSHISTSSAPLDSSIRTASSEQTYISGDYSSLLALESCSEGTNEWTNDRAQPGHREDVMYRQSTQNTSSSLPPGQMSLPSFNTQFSLDGITLQEPNPEANFQDQHTFQETTGGRKDVLLSPISLLDADVRMNTEVSKPKEMISSHKTRRRPGSRAEQMISDVENLYEFGISLAIFPEDPLLRKSLRRMKERFRHLVKLGISCDQRDISEPRTDCDD